MSTPQDEKMTAAGANTVSSSQDAGDNVSPPARDRPAASQVSQTNPNDPIGNPDPIPLGYSLDSDAPPGTYDHLDMDPGINLDENMENMFKDSYEEMLGHFGQGNDEAAEAIAAELLLWSNLPVLYRAYAHIVLAYGPVNGLSHARKAVEDARRGLENFGDRSVGEKLLAIAEETLQDVTEQLEVNEAQTATADEEEAE
ncbi:hypothetical protein M436DRAFT_66920 [Aureobasidium namibiae CBS 147.97]|uniref:Uncharacterized protein n=1 Tax=Aureobasidium namibiae CBS 147.97 TaxID=1043004 RepID=A0A074W9A7_9PEZI